jgi:uncharacterized membrane-anchored protein
LGLATAPAPACREHGKAQFKTSDTYTFLDRSDTDKFLRLNGNPPPGNSYTIAPVEGNWFGVLHFADEGYIKDDEKIDADALLAQLKENNTAGNEHKRKEGYDTLTLTGWAIPPRYDAETRRLEWGTRLRSDRDGSEVVNVSTRLLGRSGYTSAVLVTSPATLEADLADFKKALKDFDYVSGEKYSEWREGDRVAAYGLGALVLGGAAAAASSKGGLKTIFLAIAAGAAALWAGARRLLARRKSD